MLTQLRVAPQRLRITRAHKTLTKGLPQSGNSKFELGEKNGCMIIEKMLRSKDNFLSVKEPNVPDVNL
jgi:hypothetical protein